MDMMEQLQKHLSPKDFGRMQEWLTSLPPDEQARLMQFIAERETRAPVVGEDAPDFELPELGSGRRVCLSSFFGVKPVALIFGSFT